RGERRRATGFCSKGATVERSFACCRGAFGSNPKQCRESACCGHNGGNGESIDFRKRQGRSRRASAESTSACFSSRKEERPALFFQCGARSQPGTYCRTAKVERPLARVSGG